MVKAVKTNGKASVTKNRIADLIGKSEKSINPTA